MPVNGDSLGNVPCLTTRDARWFGTHRLLAHAIPVAAWASLLLFCSCARDNDEISTSASCEDVKFARLKEFAMSESPAIWETYQMLGGEIDIQSNKVGHLRQELVEFGRDPMQDRDYLNFLDLLRDMRHVQEDILAKLEEACIEKAFYDATPGKRDSEEVWRKAFQEGIRGAEASAQRFKEMREAK